MNSAPSQIPLHGNHSNSTKSHYYRELPESIESMTEHSHYDSLAKVLQLAFDQAATGKGAERHATPEPFEDQISAWIDKRGIDYPRGQAIKKIDESMHMDSNAAVRELLGAIVFLGLKVINLLPKEEEPAIMKQGVVQILCTCRWMHTIVPGQLQEVVETYCRKNRARYDSCPIRGKMTLGRITVFIGCPDKGACGDFSPVAPTAEDSKK